MKVTQTTQQTKGQGTINEPKDRARFAKHNRPQRKIYKKDFA